MAATAGAHDAIDDVRAFNRFYTRVIGVLDDGVVETSYSLPEARVLFELAQVDEGEVGEVRRSLGIDAGYLSRMLARFEAQGLIARRRSASDARRQLVQLTDLGRSEFAMLDGRSADQVGEADRSARRGRAAPPRDGDGRDSRAPGRRATGGGARAARARARRLRLDRRAARRAVRRRVRLELAHRVARRARDRRVHGASRSGARARLDRRGRRRARGLRAVREARATTSRSSGC